MNILFLVLSYPTEGKNLYSDLAEELKRRGNNVYVVLASNGEGLCKSNFVVRNNVNVLTIRTLKIQKNNKILKGIASLLIGYQFKRGIKKFYKSVKFDLLIYSTPPITLYSAIKYLKEKNKCKTYLLLKDIFPQNAVDLEMMNKNSLIYKYFRNIEIKLYKISDYIGCMSSKNREYLISNNEYLNRRNIEVCANSIKINEVNNYEKKYAAKDKVTLIYGGNLGVPQGINFLMDILKFYKYNKRFYFIIIGSGTEYFKLKNFIEKKELKNVILKKFMPQQEFEKYLKAADAGLILLDKRFTIPNFPSRMLSYMEYGKPIIAATDKNTDVRECIRAAGCGEWCESGDLKTFNKIVNKFYYDRNALKICGKNSRLCLKNNFNVEKSAAKILKHFK